MRIFSMIAILTLTAGLAASPAAFAGGGPKSDKTMHEPKLEGWLPNATGKLGRGALNVLTSPAELGCNIYYDTEHHPWLGGVTGLFKGVFFMAARIVVGAAEIVTFPIPTDPWIQPVCNGASWNWYKK